MCVKERGEGASLWFSEAALLFLIGGGGLAIAKPVMHGLDTEDFRKEMSSIQARTKFSIHGHTHQKNHRRPANQSHGRRELALIASTIVPSIFFSILHEAQFPNCPLANLRVIKSVLTFVGFGNFIMLSYTCV